MTTPATTDLVQRVLSGDQRAVARMLRRVDDRSPGFLEQLKDLYPHTGKAYVIGITGTPGAGKSTLVDGLVKLLRERDLRVGVLAVDPSSPFSGGAILGDRIRMQRHALDEKVFIRSLSTRGHVGGLSRSALDSVRVLDASGNDVILLESVGVGQDELEIAQVVHTTVVVTAPGGGDDIQAIKAGILEIADVLVVNKADRDGADSVVNDLEGMLSLGASVASGQRAHSHAVLAARRASFDSHAGLAPGALPESWNVPVLKLSAHVGQGLLELLTACEAHREHLQRTPVGQARTRSKRRAELARTFRELVLERVERELSHEIDEAMEGAGQGADPYALAQSLVARLAK
jgi:LAO/AO transport system kinase